MKYLNIIGIHILEVTDKIKTLKMEISKLCV